MGEPRERQNRTALLHVRVKPELRAKIEYEASTLKIAPSALVRKVLVEHYEKR
jgi:hypothetical protein